MSLEVSHFSSFLFHFISIVCRWLRLWLIQCISFRMQLENRISRNKGNVPDTKPISIVHFVYRLFADDWNQSSLAVCLSIVENCFQIKSYFQRKTKLNNCMMHCFTSGNEWSYLNWWYFFHSSWSELDLFSMSLLLTTS